MKTEIAGQIARGEYAPPVAVTAQILAAFWARRVSELFPGVAVTLGTKERGQLAVFIRKVGEDKALSAVAFALSNWAAFRYLANLELTGSDVCPKTPQIGVVLRHRAILINMMDACNQLHCKTL
jgi:hypothetical protein